MLTQVSLNMASALSFTTAVFIVLSAFLMNVGERRRQLSILRTVGATRRQVVGMVCYEALVMGVIGTLIGIPLGVYGGTFLMRTMANMLQTRVPDSPDMFWAFAVGGVMGPAICLVAAWYPARKAGQVSPLEGMRPVVTLQPHRGYRNAAIAGVTGLIITGFMAIGSALGVLPMGVAVFGVVLSLVSVALLLPVVLGPAVRLLALPLGPLLAVEGEMSQRMVLRHAGRSALTIGALLMAVAAGIGTSNAVFSITDDVHTWNERTVTADFLVRAMMPDMNGQDATSMDESLGKEISAFAGVERVESIRLLRVEAGDREAMVLARDYHLHDRVPLEVIEGDPSTVLAKFAEGEVGVGSVLAQRLNLHVGSTLAVVFGERTLTFRVATVATEYSFGGSVVYLDLNVARRLLGVQGVDVFLVKAAAGKAAGIEPKLRTLASDNGLIVQSFLELRSLIDSLVAGVTGGLWVLLVLGLLVGALGVVNTLTMNVLEQTRELGMLSAIGMRRHQVVKTVLGQAVFIGLLGILAGGASGLILARMINVCLGSMFGHHVTFAARPQYIAALLALALAVVLLAALFPARRASRLNAIQAMRQE